MKSTARFLAVVLVLACMSAAICGVQTFKTISVPHAMVTELYGINSSNVMAGAYFDSAGVQHGMTLAGRQLTTLDDPNGVDTFCTGINDTGMVVGGYTRGQNFVGFVYQNGTFTDILPFGSANSFVWAINNEGVMTGEYVDSNNAVLDFFGSPGSYTSFEVPGSGFSSGGGINDAGLIIVQWQDSMGNVESSLFNPAKKKNAFMKINVPGAVDTYAAGINNRQQISYAWSDASGNYHGALMTGGKFITFDDPDGSNTDGAGINDSGIIVGEFIPTGGSNFQGFLTKK